VSGQGVVNELQLFLIKPVFFAAFTCTLCVATRQLLLLTLSAGEFGWGGTSVKQ